MARPRGKVLPEQTLKLALVAEKQRWRHNEDWLTALGIESLTSVGNWLSGKPISATVLDDLADILQIEPADFSLEAVDFCQRIGLSPSVLEHVRNHVRGDEVVAAKSERLADRRMVEALQGLYVAAYLCRYEEDISREYIALRSFEIGPVGSAGLCGFVQKRNFITGSAHSGQLYCRNERILGTIDYDEYPSSIVYLMPILINSESKVLYGLYTDITAEPLKDIFATRVLFISLTNPKIEGRDIDSQDGLFDRLRSCLSNELGTRSRLTVNAGYEQAHQIVAIAREIRAALEAGTCL